MHRLTHKEILLCKKCLCLVGRVRVTGKVTLSLFSTKTGMRNYRCPQSSCCRVARYSFTKSFGSLIKCRKAGCTVVGSRSRAGPVSGLKAYTKLSLVGYKAVENRVNFMSGNLLRGQCLKRLHELRRFSGFRRRLPAGAAGEGRHVEEVGSLVWYPNTCSKNLPRPCCRSS